MTTFDCTSQSEEKRAMFLFMTHFIKEVAWVVGEVFYYQVVVKIFGQ